MEYIKIKNADKIVKDSPYVVNNPTIYKNKWGKEVFNNNHPIHLELGMGRGDFIIDMAKTYPNINFIGLEVNDSQMVNGINKLQKENLKNLKLIIGKLKEKKKIFFFKNKR